MDQPDGTVQKKHAVLKKTESREEDLSLKTAVAAMGTRKPLTPIDIPLTPIDNPMDLSSGEGYVYPDTDAAINNQLISCVLHVEAWLNCMLYSSDLLACKAFKSCQL